MRLAMLVLFAASLSAHASQTADRIVILKSKRTLILYSDGKELKSYKVALGGQPMDPSRARVITELRKASTASTVRTHTAVFTRPCIFPTPTSRTGCVPANSG